MRDLSNQNMIHLQDGSLNCLQFRRLLEYPEIVHCFTLKPHDFMAAHAEKEKPALDQLVSALGIDRSRLCRPHQTHSDHIRVVTEKDLGIFPPSLEDTDGLITDREDIFLLLTFADCTPLLFYDPIKKVIADIHSGWKGTVQRIGAKAVRNMAEHFGCDPADILCCIGPHIRKCSFEVDEDVKKIFCDEFKDMPDLSECVTWDPARSKYFIDTLRINKNLLKTAGLKEENIIDSGICTVCDSNLCHSYRADKSLSGRAAAVIALR